MQKLLKEQHIISFAQLTRFKLKLYNPPLSSDTLLVRNIHWLI